MLKDLLCIVEEGKKPSSALSQAIALSKGYNISPQYVAAVPGPPPLANLLGSDYVDELILKAKTEAASVAHKLGSQISEFARLNGYDAHVAEDSRPLVELSLDIANKARSYDITVIQRPETHLHVSSALVESVLFGSGRPVLLSPPQHQPVERFRKAVLAWDGSPSSARAVGAAIALFPDLKEVFVFTVVGEKNLDDLVPGADIAAHIRRHGIQTTVACIDLESRDGNAGPAIARFAKDHGVDLLVMGGYGHSRLREFVLGGVTEYLSKETPVPLLLVH